MVKRLALLALLLAGCTTPTLDDLVQLEVDVVRAPSAAAEVSVAAGGVVRTSPLSQRAAKLYFGEPPQGAFAVTATALDAAGNELEHLELAATYTGAKLVVTADFRPCEKGGTIGTACHVGVGACERSATWQCSADHQKAVCPATPGEPGVETCNGVDDDCDGVVDDHLTGAPACPLTKGVCASAQPVCAGTGGWGACDYGASYQATETACDGEDNDCDGVVDPMTAWDPANCGSCGHACPGTLPYCVSSTCVASCGANTHLCGHSCLPNDSIASCGTRCDSCPVPDHGQATCAAGSCGVTCDGGFESWNGACLPRLDVVHFTPSEDQWGVDVHTTVTVTFARPMNPATASAYLLSITTVAPGTLSWDATHTILRLTPANPLQPSTHYRVWLNGTVTAADGEQVTFTNHPLDFSTAPTPGLFVFGGIPETGGFLDDAWLLALPPGLPPEWIDASAPGGPPGMADAQAAYDSNAQRLLVTGGDPGLTDNANTYALTREATTHAWRWTTLVTTGSSPARARAAVAFDAAADRLLIGGGVEGGSEGGSTCFSDVMALDLSRTPSAWSAVPLGGALPGLEDAMWAWDPAARKLWITQGYGTSAGDLLATGCELLPAGHTGNPDSWSVSFGASPAAVTQSPWSHPSPQGRAAAAWNGQHLFVYGGEGSAGADELWMLDDTNGWQELFPTGTGPGPMRSGSMIWDAAGQRLILFGGDSPSSADDVDGAWAVDGLPDAPAWEKLVPAGTAPPHRTSFAFAQLDDASAFANP